MASNAIISSDSSEEEGSLKLKENSTYSSQRCSEPSQKKADTAKRAKMHRKNKTPGSGVRVYSYSGKRRKKKWQDEQNQDHETTQPVEDGDQRMLEENDTPAFGIIDENEQATSKDGDIDVDALMSTIGFGENETRSTARTWQEREIARNLSWANGRRKVFESGVSFKPHSHLSCSSCRQDTKLQAIRCLTCKQNLCWNCDYEKHIVNPFHRRIHVTQNVNDVLLPSMFFDKNWKHVEQDVYVPCFLPSSCVNCKSPNAIQLMASSKDVVVVTPLGRFDLKASKYVCQKCAFEQIANTLDYVNAGFWPGDFDSHSYLFAEELLFTWFHMQHKSPGASLTKFVNILEEHSKENGRKGTINRSLFARAAQEWEFSRHTTEVEICKHEKMFCPLCGTHPIMGSSDACVKCSHLKSAGAVRKVKNQRDDLEDESVFYGDLAIVSDEVVQSYRDHIYTKIKRGKQKEMCSSGGAVFKAAKVDAKKANKYDVSGLIASACRHASIRKAINMHHGETFTHTHFMHNLCYKMNCRFFCYDVVCRYWKFAKKVGYAFPEYRPMTKRMRCFLPMMHAKAHNFQCQCLFNPHWKSGNGMTHGEDHEQIFSKLYRYAHITKRMKKNARILHLSAAIFYWNRSKFDQMAKMLARRIEKARKAVPVNLANMNKLMTKNNLQSTDLPNIFKELQYSAKISQLNKPNRTTSLEKMKRNLEGLYIQLQNAKIFVTTQAEYCKARTKLRSTMSKTKAKAKKVIALINLQKRPNYVTEADFDSGNFQWNDENTTTSSQKMTVFEKYSLVDSWQRLNRAREEIPICKKELANLLQFLAGKRSSLQLDVADCYRQPSDPFLTGKAIVLRTEIARLSSKIEETLLEFQLCSSQHFRSFFLTEREDEAESKLGNPILSDWEDSDVSESAESITGDDAISEDEEGDTSNEAESDSD